ncbi:radical SAM protein [Clostridium butyricum]|uniref:radical SAM protein n=1 Tax=Clostridium butyricum TaxID=1492 RepID=UPI002106FB04|nr:radical SAM protein [Clostridium butyricum]MCQ2014187.1 radical SAM protein [Clostridium butyricum]MCQ2026277.1 radical SAM protein [Clostridium butyricum]
MRSPKDMRIIQIDITNRCVHECSNCIRFCGHHKKPYYMEWEMFKKSVDSLLEFGNTIGIMGGEPTLHPQFERFVNYLAEKYPSQYKLPSNRKPIINFPRYIHDKNYLLDETLNNRKGPGLWTSVSKNYYKYFELIQDTFSFQNINDHDNPCLHQPILVSRKEIGISDEEWVQIRDNCICQNLWSASITPKGAFFCEVAGALDMLFDGPGGWKVEEGWWKREPKDFGEQLKWCEICGGALFKKGRLSSEEIDDVSPILYEKLKNVDSPKLKKGKVLIMEDFNIGKNMPNTINRYLTEHNERVSKDNKVIYPKNINIVKMHNNDENFNRCIKRSLYDEVNDWIIISKSDEASEELINRLKLVVLNPGVMYIYRDKYIFNVNAKALKIAGYDGVNNINSLDDFIALWDKEKIITIYDDFDKDTNPDIEEWKVYVDKLKIDDKTELEKCIEKIESDYKSRI